MTTEKGHGMDNSPLKLCLVATVFLFVFSCTGSSQSITTIITSPSMVWTEDMALSDHGAAYIARTGTSNPAANEVYAYIFAIHQLLQISTNSVEDHSLVGSGDRLLWVEGHGSTSTLREYLLSRGLGRQIASPVSAQDLAWIDLSKEQALAHDSVTRFLWNLDIPSDTWTVLSTVYRHGTDGFDVNGKNTIWTEPHNLSVALFHQTPGGLRTTVHTTGNKIDHIQVRFPFVVWMENSGGSQTYEVYSHDLTTKTTQRITDNQYDDTNPVLVGDLVVWLAPLYGTGPVVFHYKDLARSGPIQIQPTQAKTLQSAWDGVFFTMGPNGRTLAHYNFLETRTTTVDTALDIKRPDIDGSGRMAMFRKFPHQIRLFMPTFDLRPSDPFAWENIRVGMYLVAGSIWKFNGFRVAASASGFRPGIQIGFVNIPLNFDTVMVLSVYLSNTPPFENTYSTLSGLGTALAYFNPTPALRQALIGTDFFWAYVLIPPDMASNVVRMQYRP